MTQISIIVAVAENNAIGKDNKLLWHLPGDLKRFKQLTSGHTIVMGKNTYFSLPKRPLPNRRHIVITDIPDEQIDDCVMAYSIEEAVAQMDKNSENFIVGGASVYRQFLPLADKLYITWVHKAYDADTFFPEISKDAWTIESRIDFPESGEETPFSYVTYKRIN